MPPIHAEGGFASGKRVFVPESGVFVPGNERINVLTPACYRRALNFTVASFSPLSTFTEIGAAKSAAIS